MPDHDVLLQSWRDLLRDNADSGVPRDVFFAGRMDEDAELVHALATGNAVRERSFRQGVIAAVAGERFFTAVLIWRDHIHGVFRHDLFARDAADIARDLGEFRLGWLPDETVRESGGQGSAFAVPPPEAEGFPVTFITGTNSARFAGCGKIVDTFSGAAGRPAPSC